MDLCFLFCAHTIRMHDTYTTIVFCSKQVFRHCKSICLILMDKRGRVRYFFFLFWVFRFIIFAEDSGGGQAPPTFYLRATGCA